MRDKKLLDVLAGLGLHLNHSECVEVVSKLGQPTNRHAQAADISDVQQRAEQYLDELLEGIFEENYKKFTQRFEKKYLPFFHESEFKESIRNRFEDVGDYIHREFLGCLNRTHRSDDNRYPNHVRYIWRCFFDKNEVIIRVGIYRKNGTYYVCEAGTL